MDLLPKDQFNENEIYSYSTNKISQLIEILLKNVMNGKKIAEDELRRKKESEISDYEGLLQKLEGEVRQHIRVAFLLILDLL